MGRKKKDFISNSLINFVSKTPKNLLTKQRVPLSERRAPLRMKRKTDAKHGDRAHIYTLNREICQVKKDKELGCQTVREVFFSSVY
jgi:hypothetical protein